MMNSKFLTATEIKMQSHNWRLLMSTKEQITESQLQALPTYLQLKELQKLVSEQQSINIQEILDMYYTEGGG